MNNNQKSEAQTQDANGGSLHAVVMCDCVNQAPTYPTCRDFEHFPECPLAPQPTLLFELPLTEGRVMQYFGPKYYWRNMAVREMNRAEAAEAKYHDLLRAYNDRLQTRP